MRVMAEASRRLSLGRCGVAVELGRAPEDRSFQKSAARSTSAPPPGGSRYRDGGAAVRPLFRREAGPRDHRGRIARPRCPAMRPSAMDRTAMASML